MSMYLIHSILIEFNSNGVIVSTLGANGEESNQNFQLVAHEFDATDINGIMCEKCKTKEEMLSFSLQNYFPLN